MLSARFYQGICLNVLAYDLENAKAIYQATDGHVLIGLLSTNYQTVEEAVEAITKYTEELGGAISIGLGAGDPHQWKMVAEICRAIHVEHVNQVFPAVGYTRACLNDETPFINGLVQPADKPGYVNIKTGPLSSQQAPAEIHLASAISLIKDMGGNSVKLFPLNGLQMRKQYEEIARICAREHFPLEPTGGITVQNFAEVVAIALEAGVQTIIPHVYSSIIDKTTGKTRVEDVKKLYDIIKRVGIT